MAEAQRERPRGPGITFSALMLALLVLLGLVALTQRTPPPPTIAEFAPQAVENITDAPTDQSSSSGRSGGAGGSGGGSETAAPAPSVAPIDVPRVRKCVGDPPRQIEDPQSPPCVAYWTGDNGGATSKGVTRDEIRVAVPQWNGDPASDTALLGSFFNKRFEFYGRKLVLVGTAEDWGGKQTDCPIPRAAAVAADEQRRVFISTSPQSDTQNACYVEELARRNILSVTQDAEFQEANDPHLWSYKMALEDMFDSLGAWTCNRVAGGRPQGDALATKRRFGLQIWSANNAYVQANVPRLRSALKTCDEKLASESEGLFAEADNNIIRMREAGVTTAICVCNASGMGYLQQTSSHQGYTPEWITFPYQDHGTNFLFHVWGEPSQMARTFGVAFNPKQVPVPQLPLFWALKEMNPGYTVATETIFASNETSGYQALLLVASGLQMAGPKLTPEAFAQGLHNTRFPNPVHPNMAGSVGFLDGDHTMTDDGAEWRWDPAGRSPYREDGVGAMCYFDGGKRYTKVAWPRGGDVYTHTCDTGVGTA